jgi:hypothetical protein
MARIDGQSRRHTFPEYELLMKAKNEFSSPLGNPTRKNPTKQELILPDFIFRY